jgi:hypothetical protein
MYCRLRTRQYIPEDSELQLKNYQRLKDEPVPWSWEDNTLSTSKQFGTCKAGQQNTGDVRRDPLRPSGNYMNHLLLTVSYAAFYIYWFCMVLTVNSDYFLKTALKI